MFLGCLYLGPLLFPLLLNTEIVTCFLFNCFAVKLQSLLSCYACLQRSTVSCHFFFFISFIVSRDNTKKNPNKFFKSALGKPNILTTQAEINPRTSGPQQLLNRLSALSLFFLLLKISWPFRFGKFSHTCIISAFIY